MKNQNSNAPGFGHVQTILTKSKNLIQYKSDELFYFDIINF